jgi:hypothetical protein
MISLALDIKPSSEKIDIYLITKDTTSLFFPLCFTQDKNIHHDIPLQIRPAFIPLTIKLYWVKSSYSKEKENLLLFRKSAIIQKICYHWKKICYLQKILFITVLQAKNNCHFYLIMSLTFHPFFILKQPTYNSMITINPMLNIVFNPLEQESW